MSGPLSLVAQLPGLRVAVAPALALGLVLALGGPTIGWLRRLGAGQRVRDDGPQRHLQKEGTPTMGGVLIVGAMAVGAALGQLAAPGRLTPEIGVLIAGVLAYAAIGAADDWMKVRRGRSLGLRARQKLALQVVAAAAFVVALGAHRAGQAAEGLPPQGGPLTPAWAAFWLAAVVWTSNAVNLSDGLDGLAAGLCVVGGVGFALLAVRGQNPASAALGLALAGACLGFLAFNRHPAKVFMGDIGSLALGAALAMLAAWLDEPMALVGLCLVPFIEAGSVVVQVVSFKTTGKRVFRMSPIHHHFELLGWSERRVVSTFWAVALVAGAAAVGLRLAQ